MPGEDSIKRENMPGEESTKREDNHPTPPSNTFEFKSLDHLSLVEYQCPSSNPTQSVARNFFRGGAASRNTSVTESYTADGRSIQDNLDDSDLDDPYLYLNCSSSHLETSWNPEGLVNILKRKLDEANKQLAQANKDLENADRKLMATEKRLDRMHKQNVHSAQELAAAIGTQSKENFDAPQTDQGLVPFLVHCSSIPLLKKRITFATDFNRAPKVIIGMQTGHPSVMTLVCALDVDKKGFTVHADLINRSSFAEMTELMKCQVSWMAFESQEGIVDGGARIKRPRH